MYRIGENIYKAHVAQGLISKYVKSQNQKVLVDQYELHLDLRIRIS